MKLSSILCAAFVSLATLTPTTASAGHDSSERTRVTYDHCGRPIYWTYTCVAHDHCGRPVYRWVQSSRGGYGGHDSYSGHGGGYERGGYGGGYERGGYGGGRDSCDGRGYRSSRSRGGVSFHYSR